MQRLVLISIVILLFVGLPNPATEAASASPQPTIAIEGPIWNHVPVSVLVNTTNSQYVNSALTAIRTWRAAIRDFATSYNYPYMLDLAKLDFAVYLAGVNATLNNYDVTIGFVNISPSESGWAGIAYYSASGDAMGYVRILISTELPNPQFVPAEMQIVVAHELGHALGLGHTTNESSVPTTPLGDADLMNGKGLGVVTSEIPNTPSNLDVYALTLKYEWVSKGSFFNPNMQNVTLPSSMQYHQLGLRYVSITYLPFLVNGQPAMRGNWYPVGYNPPAYLFDTPQNATFDDVRYSFMGWSGSGQGSYTGSNLIPSIRVLNSNVSETAIWSVGNQLRGAVTTENNTIQQLQSTVNGQNSQIHQLQAETQAQGGSIGRLELLAQQQGEELNVSYVAIGVIVMVSIVSVLFLRRRVRQP